ncbi:MAG: 50S ribosomal protein L4 [Winkia neuii]|uniref:Large ribosomal subunit protein uL4 n=1 Tax=Winkia neuii TaxID=33007 RepID=A0A2I1ING2_9ACTO|nr:50S ribosomal protein L4 [Winkia neuii]OFJ71758.1 50S ribosomal protein L4 [Actinomyces sp. HMSC064C12]OFK01238.1 50S ribosomal protein L4 [Actinomyces sp. HMSC072A03]OFT55722.1 50S ribosomal protein L4 [Actinomyces sp. HMSC06A08]KWZ73221.1 50S ribosomal protein L4 [Winkia neuii]MDK8099097.1 50S ribosomal protein L4 [Winkia neuii]
MSENLTIEIVDAEGKATGTYELPAEIFDRELNIPLIHQVVVAQLAAARQGTHATKTRGKVRGGGRKPWKQKGTGRARQGSIRSPQWVGGGVSHGPQPRDYSQRTPKKMKLGALYSALSDRFRKNRMHVVSQFMDVDATPKTKTAKAVVNALVAERHPLVVLAREELSTASSLSNLQEVTFLWADQLNTYDVVDADDVIFTTAALDNFLGKGKEEDK